jgi:hypothetical protein
VAVLASRRCPRVALIGNASLLGLLARARLRRLTLSISMRKKHATDAHLVLGGDLRMLRHSNRNSSTLSYC